MAPLTCGPDEPRAALEQSYQPRSLPADPAREGGPMREDPDRHAELLNRVSQALQANLDRGYFESEARIRQIAEALHDVVALSDETGARLFFVNAAYEQIWGRSREELYANPLAFLDGVHPDDRERVRDAMLGHPGSGYDLEFRVVRPAGDVRWVCARGFPVRTADGEVGRTASIIEDITDRKQVILSHERLVRGFTHDVQNPLGAADGYLALLEEGVFGEMSATQLTSVIRARRSIHAAVDLVAQLLEIERAEAGQLAMERELMDVGAAAGETVEEFGAAAEAKHLELVLRVLRGDDSLIIRSNLARVRQIVANLVSNAVKYTPPGGLVSVRVRAGDTDEAPWRGPWVAVTVSDTGPGIPVSKQHLVFREFSRFNPSEPGGSGIGLAIGRRLAHALGGEITFESTPGVGSTFTLWLPADGGIGLASRYE